MKELPAGLRETRRLFQRAKHPDDVLAVAEAALKDAVNQTAVLCGCGCTENIARLLLAVQREP